MFTNHAKKRMRERGVSKRQIVATLQQPKSIRKEDGSITIFSQKFGSNTYDKQADALYIYLGAGRIKKTLRAGKNILVDMGDKDRVLGVEFYKISRSVPEKKLHSVSVELPMRA
ncbi:MAG TPA: DUF2283 domain-containing protein [Candidatus Paceibacterota bacterium]